MSANHSCCPFRFAAIRSGSGNGGFVGDNSNFDGYVNKRGQITVCAVDDNGVRPWYGETGANVGAERTRCACLDAPGARAPGARSPSFEPRRAGLPGRPATTGAAGRDRRRD